MAYKFSSNKEEVLLAAAWFGDLSNLKNAAKDLDKGKGIKETILQTKYAMGQSALHLAAGEGRMNICVCLIEELGLPPDVCCNKGQTPLHCAAGKGRIEIVKYLIAAGADPNCSDLTGLTPLSLAAGTGHSEVVEHLLSKGVEVDPDSWIGTPLFLAALHSQEATMEILLHHNADVNKVILNIKTPLKMSVETGSLNCTRLLIKAGADVNLKAPIVEASERNASERNAVEILMCLLDAGADPNVPDICGQFAIEAAAKSGNIGIVQMLFPITSPLPNVTDWTLHGVFSYVNSKAYDKKFEAQCKKILDDMKRRGDDAFRRKEYGRALSFYPCVPPTDATVCANKSLCWLQVGDPLKASTDAQLALTLKPDWPEAYYRLGAALMSLKDYERAFQVLSDGFKLDPEDTSIEKALREAAEKMKEAGV